MHKRVIILGAGFTGMSVAATLASRGYEVDIFEKSDIPGGKARQFSADGFSFDMGPIWFSYPKLVQHFFETFRSKNIQFPKLKSLNPSYRLYIQGHQQFDIPYGEKAIRQLFAGKNTQAETKFSKYFKKAAEKYHRFEEIFESGCCLNDLNKGGLAFLSGKHSKYIRSLFQDQKLLAALEFPVCAPGMLPLDHHILSFAKNYSLFTEGLQYPVGGTKVLVDAMLELLDKLGVSVHLLSPVDSYDLIADKVTGIITHGKNFHADYFIAATDYHHAEHLLPADKRNYPESYWDKFKRSPSALIFYLGIDKELKNFAPNAAYFHYAPNSDTAKQALRGEMRDSPAMFFSCPSKITPQVAPSGKSTMVIQVVIPPGIEDIGKVREHYFEQAINTIEKITSEKILDYITYKRTYAQTDFESDYHTYHGKAFGFLADTALQKKPMKMQNQHLKNLFYAEQASLPGGGIASAMLSGKFVANKVLSYDQQ